MGLQASHLAQSWPWGERSCRSIVCPIATDQIRWASKCTFYQAFWMSPRQDSDLNKTQLQSRRYDESICNQALPVVTRLRSWALDDSPPPMLKPLWMTHTCDGNAILYLMPLQIVYSNLKKIISILSYHPYSLVHYPWGCILSNTWILLKSTIRKA